MTADLKKWRRMILSFHDLVSNFFARRQIATAAQPIPPLAPNCDWLRLLALIAQKKFDETQSRKSSPTSVAARRTYSRICVNRLKSGQICALFKKSYAHHVSRITFHLHAMSPNVGKCHPMYPFAKKISKTYITYTSDEPRPRSCNTRFPLPIFFPSPSFEPCASHLAQRY